ncbi:hypothetical protein [Prosthecobacter sp.]|uniref:hypothetical protein n=1 Tax=Prosthecobacter sp. TaxID=1965333 RepID=UPI003782FCD5
MADPWRVLGLQRDTADEKQVRSAYARLLKVRRPDQDPEGFHQLRTAYEMALQWLKTRSAAEAGEDDWLDDFAADGGSEVSPVTRASPSASLPLPPSFAPGEVPFLPHRIDQEPPQPAKPKVPRRPERNWPREWSYSLESLDRALQGGVRQLEVVSMALKALAMDAAELGIPSSTLECIISDAFFTEPGLFGKTVPVSILASLLVGGGAAFLLRVLEALEQERDSAHLVHLAQKLDECLDEAFAPRSAEVFFRAATLAALERPFLAQSMLRKLQHWLKDSSSSAEKFERLHAAIARGMALRDLPANHREFWTQRLDYPATPCDWKAAFPEQALAAVVILGKSWAGHPLVQPIVPQEVWKKAWKRRWLKVTMHGLLRTRTVNPKSVMFAVVGSLLFVFGARLFDNITPVSKPEPAVQSEEFKRSYQRGLEVLKEYREKKKQEKTGPEPK